MLRLYVVVDPALPEHENERLLIKADVDPVIIGRTKLELYSMITEYTISKLSHLAGVPNSSKELTPEILQRVRERANDLGDTPVRDHVRAELYGLPGAWPCLLTWERPLEILRIQLIDIFRWLDLPLRCKVLRFL